VAEVAIENDGVKDDVVFNTIQVKRGDEKQLVYHWYQTSKGIVLKNGFNRT